MDQYRDLFIILKVFFRNSDQSLFHTDLFGRVTDQVDDHTNLLADVTGEVISHTDVLADVTGEMADLTDPFDSIIGEVAGLTGLLDGLTSLLDNPIVLYYPFRVGTGKITASSDFRPLSPSMVQKILCHRHATLLGCSGVLIYHNIIASVVTTKLIYVKKRLEENKFKFDIQIIPC